MPKPFNACLFTYKSSKRVIIWPLVKVFELLILLPASCSISCEARANSPTMDGKTQCTYSSGRCAVAGNVRPSAVRPLFDRPRRTNAAAGGPSQQQQRRSSIPSLQTGVFAAPSRVAPRWLWLGASIRDAPGRPPPSLLKHRRTTWSLGLATTAAASSSPAETSSVVALLIVFPFWMKVKCWGVLFQYILLILRRHCGTVHGIFSKPFMVPTRQKLELLFMG